MSISAYSNPAGELRVCPRGYVLLRYAAGRHGAEAIAELLTQAGGLLLRHDYHGLLTDAGRLEGLREDALNWVVQHWLSHAVPQPARLHKALVVPASPVAAAIATLRARAPHATHYAYFGSFAAAHHYLATLAA